MTYGQIIGLVFIIFVLLAVLTVIKQFAITIARVLFEILMLRKEKAMRASEQKTIAYKGSKNDTNDNLEVRNRIGFQ